MSERAHELVERWQRHRDAAAREELVRLYTPLVKRWVTKYPGARAWREDALQEGMIGLLVAIDRFDTSRGTAFGSYAAIWIRCYVVDFTKRGNQVRRIGDRESRKLYFAIGRLSRELARQGREVTPAAIAELADTRLDVVHAVLDHMRHRDVELDAPREGGGPRSDLFAATNVPQDELLDEVREAHRRRCALEHAIAQLGERERMVLRMRRLEEPARTLQELSAELGVSRERVRQIEMRAVARVAQLARRGAPGFSTSHRPGTGGAKPAARVA